VSNSYPCQGGYIGAIHLGAPCNCVGNPKVDSPYTLTSFAAIRHRRADELRLAAYELRRIEAFVSLIRIGFAGPGYVVRAEEISPCADWLDARANEIEPTP
jgi:hypothetical protein